MKKIMLIVTITFISLIVINIFVLTPLGWKVNLINPMGQGSQNSDETLTPASTPNAPKTFNFDNSTDLEAELEKVNPQILDSDFE